MAVHEVEPHYYLTLDDADENRVLELVQVLGDKMFIRDNGMWMPIDPDADNERVWDRQIIDVSAEAANEYDLAEEDTPLEITRDMFEDYEIAEEDVA